MSLIILGNLSLVKLICRCLSFTVIFIILLHIAKDHEKIFYY